MVTAVCIFAFTLFFNVEDAFWSSSSIALVIVCALRIYRVTKYKNDEEYAKKIDIDNKDERNQFLANKAKSTAFYLYVSISGALVIILRFFGYREASFAIAMSICGLVFLYWIAYFFVKRKY